MNVNTSYSTSATNQIQSRASAPMPPQQKMANLFDQIDTTGSGTITKDQFTQAFQALNPPSSFQKAGADAVWSKLDPNGTGTVSKQDFTKDMAAMMKQLRGHHHHHQSSAAGAQGLTQSASQLTALGTAATTPSSTSGGTTSAGSIMDLLA